MTGLDINEFMNKVYYGDEIEFELYGRTYFIQGHYENKKYDLTVDYWIVEDGTEEKHDYLFSISCNSPEERLKKFEEAKIFNGKTIYDVEKFIIVKFA